MRITTERNPTPMVRILAATLRRSALHDEARMSRLNGTAAICSMHDPQAVTICFRRGDVHLTHGRADGVDVSITTDLAMDGLADAPKPRVTGALRHLRFALSLGKVLDPPLPDWRTGADSFWAKCSDRPHMPSAMTITDTDTDTRHVLGDPSTGSYELTGAADRLARIFVGSAFALEEIMEGRVHARGSLAAGSAVTHAGLAMALGQISEEN